MIFVPHLFYIALSEFIEREKNVNRLIHLLTVSIFVLYCSPIVQAEPMEEPLPPASNENAAAPPNDSNLSGQVADLQMGSEPPAPAAPAPNVQGKQVIASTDSDWPDVTVDVTELKRTSGDTLTLKFAINNGSGKDVDFGYDFGTGTGDFNSIGAVHLLDVANKKKYFVVRDSEGACLCSRGLKSVTPGAKLNLWAKFPAPPVNVSKISIEIPHFIPIDDVPIS